ncbi:MAG: CHRD domain-containing protein, partial [Chloroflexota bacterium]|nr:CHRD domain-containing protein [Chloroflexota bacterium]
MQQRVARHALAIVLGVALLMLFAGSNSPAFAQARSNTTTRASTNASASLRHTPSGFALLLWNPHTQRLTVTIALFGLAPNSVHPAHIHSGICSTNGPILFPLNTVMANAGGDALTTTSISNVAKGIPATGWSINVHNGPTLATSDQAIPIACGNIVNHHTSHHKLQVVHTRLGLTTAPNQAVSGRALLHLSNGTLTVTVTVHGLVPGSTHPAHIHAGSCLRQVPGTVVFPLNPLVGDAHGNAHSVTTITGVSAIPE